MSREFEWVQKFLSILSQWQGGSGDSPGRHQQGNVNSSDPFDDVVLRLGSVEGVFGRGVVLVDSGGAKFEGFLHPEGEEGGSKAYYWTGRFSAKFILSVDKHMVGVQDPVIQIDLGDPTSLDEEAHSLSLRFCFEDEQKEFAWKEAERFHNALSRLTRSFHIRHNLLADSPLGYSSSNSNAKPKKEQRKQDRNNRRRSIDMGAINDMLLSDGETEEEPPTRKVGKPVAAKNDDVIDDNSRKRKNEEFLQYNEQAAEVMDRPQGFETTPQRQNQKPQPLDFGIDQEDEKLCEMIRNLVRSPERVSEAVCEEIEQTYSYQLSLVRTPTQERLEFSPPRNKEWTLKQRKTLKPVVKELMKRDQDEKELLERVTSSTISGPHGRSHHFKYVDQNTKQVLSPREYGARYLAYLRKTDKPQQKKPIEKPASAQKSAKKNIVKGVTIDVENIKPMSVNITPRHRANAGKTPIKGKPMKQPSTGKKKPLASASFETELQEAEELMHRMFDEALDLFMATRKKLEIKYGLAKPTAPEPVAAKPAKSRQSTNSRRKSIDLDDILEIYQEQPPAKSPLNPQKRVIWSAKQ